jgi:AmiR/NasT family two-component response regulator
MKTIDEYKQEIQKLEKKIETLESKEAPVKTEFNLAHNKMPPLKCMKRELKIFAKNSNILIVSDTFKDSICEDAISSFAIVTKVHSFEEVKHTMKNIHYHIVIISGIEKISVLEDLRILNPNICALFITHIHNDALFLKLIEVGIDGFLYYPFSQEQFIHQLMSVAEKVMYRNLIRKYEIEQVVKVEVEKVRVEVEREAILCNAKYKLSAKDFLAKFKDTPQYDKVMEDLHSFMRLSENFEGIMYDIVENGIFSDNLIDESIEYFTKAEKLVFDIGSFDEIGLAFGELIIIYEKQNSKTILDIDIEIYRLINDMEVNLMKLIEGIFIKENLIDINYLDDFFVNNIFNIKEKLGMATSFSNDSNNDVDLSGFLL